MRSRCTKKTWLGNHIFLKIFGKAGVCDGRLQLYPTQHGDKAQVLVQVRSSLKTVEHPILLKIENEDFDKG